METTIKKYELRKNETDFPRTQIKSSAGAADFIRTFYSDDIGIFESSFILLLDQSNTTIGYAKISQGGVTGTVVDPLIVAKYAVDSLAKGIILAHNHPSGNLSPSNNDIALTKQIKDGLKLFDVTVMDHIILTEGYYTSLSDEGLM